MAAMMSAPERRPDSGQKTYHQEFAMVEVSDTSTEINLDARMGPQEKKRTFQSGIDFTGSPRATESLEGPVVFAGYGNAACFTSPRTRSRISNVHAGEAQGRM